MAKTDLSQLKQTELRALFVLMVQARRLTNRDPRELAGTDLSSGRGEHLQAGLDRRGISLGELFQPTSEPADTATSLPSRLPVAEVKDRIRAAYTARPKAPGGRVGLADLRADLSDLSREDVDAALRELAREKGVRLDPFDNTRSLDQEDRDAALHLGDSPRHMIAVKVGRPPTVTPAPRRLSGISWVPTRGLARTAPAPIGSAPGVGR